MSDEFFKEICENNYTPHTNLTDFSIGFTKIGSVIYIFPSIAVFLNFISIAYFLKNLKKPKLSIEKMMGYLTFLEFIISIYWLINSIVFKNVGSLNGITACKKCFASSIFSVFVQNFDWMIFLCTLYNLLKFFEDPAHEKGGYAYKFKWYLVVSASASTFYTYFVYIGQIYGISPMLTCYINNYSTNAKRDEAHDLIRIYSILILPLFYIFSTIYLFVRLYHTRSAIKISESKREIIKFLIYSLIYALFYFPTIILYLVTISYKMYSPSLMSWFAYYCFLSNISLNAVLSLIRIFQGHISINLTAQDDEISGVSMLNDSMSVSESERSFSINYRTGKINTVRNKINIDVDGKYDQFTIKSGENKQDKLQNISDNNILDMKENLLDKGRKGSKTISDYSIPEKKRPKTRGSLHNIQSENSKMLTNNIFIGLAHCLLKNETDLIEFLSLKSFDEKLSYTITKENFNIQNFKNVPIEYVDEHMNIEVIEFAPSVFQKLRNFDGISHIEIFNSLNVEYKAKITDSQGYSQAIFISTQDNRYILKTLKDQEFKNVFDKFLIFFVNYLEKNPDSLLCRIYGIYSIKPTESSDHLLFILLRNAKGPFNKYIDITYDLKGSTRGRKVQVPNDLKLRKKITRKDLNFIEDEKNMKLVNIDKFLGICEKDAKFLEDFDFMDYSLFVVKMNFDRNSIVWFENFKQSLEYKNYEKYIYKSSDSDYSFCIFCIIDYFQVFDFSKNLENKYKLIGGAATEIPDISCVPPDMYCYRFIKFMKNNIK